MYQGAAISTENLLGLKKDDLIKTTKGNVGIVIATNKDNIKILDTTNAIQIVGNLDYESKINTRNLSAKNKNGDHIENQTIIRIRKGIHEVFSFQLRAAAVKLSTSSEISSSSSAQSSTKQEEWQFSESTTA